MQSYYAEVFEREMGCTEPEWLRWLPPALGPHPFEIASGLAFVRFEPGTLRLHWHALEPLRIAMVRMPRLHVGFTFDGLDESQRQRFMQRFDLYMQRGGG